MATDGASACQLLAQTAKRICLIVMEYGVTTGERTAGKVATLLCLIAGETYPPHEIDDTAENAAICILHTLLPICTWSHPQRKGPMTPEQVQSCIASQNDQALRKCILESFRKNKGVADVIKALCDEFLANLRGGDHKDVSRDWATPASKIARPNDYPRHVSKYLFDILRQHAACRDLVPSTLSDHWDLVAGDMVHAGGISHPARLHLDGSLQPGREHAEFEIVISGFDMGYWQDLWVGIPTELSMRRPLVKFPDMSDEDDSDDDSLSKVDSNYFCKILNLPLNARAKVKLVHGVGLVRLLPLTPLERFLCSGEGLSLRRVLQDYKLTDKDKIILAHTIAHAFWQFYASDLMQSKWGSQDIWFMQETDGQRHPKDQLALRAYMPLNFGGGGETPEVLDDPDITHPFPHILALGVILLEIGLKQPLESISHSNLPSALNFDHGTARQRLNDLEDTSWTRPKHREIFTKAVASCLDPSAFLAQRKRKKTKTTLDYGLSNRTSGEPDVDDRRRRLYETVVEPLSVLVNTAFKKDPRYVSYISRCRDAEAAHRSARPQVASFHTGKPVVPQEWLQNLSYISQHIRMVQVERSVGALPSVKIAILDTGYSSELPFFKKKVNSARIQGWKDYVKSEDGPHKTPSRDIYGHGSLMARLVMETAPLAQVHVARVARNTEELQFSKQNIADAIRWAGDQGVDIISMSFGFQHFDDDISRAIEDVERKHNTIFMASAGNNAAHQDETFPARHRSVISIRATNCDGTFSASNPPTDPGTSFVLGTYGDNLPKDICSEMEACFGSHICQPGSSVATAVAAGIAATTITYAELLHVTTVHDPRLVRSLKTREGMLRMLEKMAPEQKGHQKFVNPVWLWSERASEPLKAWAAMYDSVSPLISQR